MKQSRCNFKQGATTTQDLLSRNFHIQTLIVFEEGRCGGVDDGSRHVLWIVSNANTNPDDDNYNDDDDDDDDDDGLGTQIIKPRWK